MKISVAIPTRNDNYGGNQLEVATATLHTMSRTFDEVLVVDYGSVEPFAPVLREALGEHLGNIRVITVPRSWVLEHTGDDHTFADTTARNIGVRRARNDIITSSNIDIIPAPLSAFDFNQYDPRVFYTSPKYMIEQPWISTWREQGLSWEGIQNVLCRDRTSYYRQGGFDGDPWSKVSGCGDFQLGHRDIWYHPAVRGFEEAFTLRNHADSNLHKKIIEFAKTDVQPAPFFHLFHQSHHQPTTAAHNDQYAVLSGFTHTTNDENWGAALTEFEECVL